MGQPHGKPETYVGECKEMKEQQIQEKILKFLNGLPNTYAIKHNVIGMYSRAGEPDIIGSCFGQAVVIEVKTDTGVVSKLQEKKLALWEAAGALSFIVTPSTYAEFERQINCRVEDVKITRAAEDMKFKNALRR